MHLVIFESRNWPDLAPLTLTRPAALLRCGVTTLLEKQIRAVRPTRITLWTRDELAATVRREAAGLTGLPVAVKQPLDGEPAILIDGAALPDESFTAPGDNQPWAMTDTAGGLLAAGVTDAGLSAADALRNTPRWQTIATINLREPSLRRIRHWGDLVDRNTAAILADAADWSDPAPPRAVCVNTAGVHARAGAKVSPGVVLDASNGPVLLDHDCVIGANSVLEGPCYVGPHTRIRPLSLVRAGSSIGPVCRVGGEVSGTIFQGYSNKSHDGFLGDSYVGQWVNCGAGTTTSNLKSTYGPIRLMLGRCQLDTGRTLLGAAIGDHAKLATYTQLGAGGYVGVASMVALSGRVPAFTASFRFVTDGGDVDLDPAKAADIATRMQQRRSIAFAAADQAVLDYARRAASEIEH